jgi:hypothetical protein
LINQPFNAFTFGSSAQAIDQRIPIITSANTQRSIDMNTTYRIIVASIVSKLENQGFTSHLYFLISGFAKQIGSSVSFPSIQHLQSTHGIFSVTITIEGFDQEELVELVVDADVVVDAVS